MKVYIVDTNHYLSTPITKDLRRKTLIILKALKLPKESELCITFVDDSYMRLLNNEYRGINRTTDVLAFSQLEDNSSELNAAIATKNNPTYPIGDIIISLPTAKRHAHKHHLYLPHLLTKLTIHGTLHLLGFDHKKIKEKLLMREKERKLLYLIKSH